VIELPSLTAVIQKEDAGYVSTCPQLGVASQGKTRKEAYAWAGRQQESLSNDEASSTLPANSQA